MKGHTGGAMSMGTGLIHSKSSKQKLNTKSSTETEVVGASDYKPWTIWTKRFLMEQGYDLTRNVFYQEIMSAMKIEKNGRKSCGDKSRHFYIRYFFIKDILKNEGIELKHCSTERMIADYFTKPLQGKLFKKIRDIIMGLAPFPMEERVEKRHIDYTSENDVETTVHEQSATYAQDVQKQVTERMSQQQDREWTLITRRR